MCGPKPLSVAYRNTNASRTREINIEEKAAQPVSSVVSPEKPFFDLQITHPKAFENPAEFSRWSSPDFSQSDPCLGKVVPSSSHYFQFMDGVSLGVIIGGCVLCFLVLLLFLLHLDRIFHYISSYSRAGRLTWLTGLFPITAAASIVGICVPRAMPIADLLILLYFSACLFIFMELVVEFFGGRFEMSVRLRGKEISLSTPPLCCLCPFLPKLKPTEGNVRKLEFLVYQAAMVKPVIFFIRGCMWADRVGRMAGDESVETPILAVLNLLSTMTAMWGMTIFANISSGFLKHFGVVVLIRVMQVLTFLYNIQGNVFGLLVNTFRVIPCDQVLPATARANLWHHFLLIVEVFFVSLVVTWLLQPSWNAAFDLHPSHQTLPHNAAPRRFPNGKPYISSPKAVAKWTGRDFLAETISRSSSPSGNSINSSDSAVGSKSHSAGYGSGLDSERNSDCKNSRNSQFDGEHLDEDSQWISSENRSTTGISSQFDDSRKSSHADYV